MSSTAVVGAGPAGLFFVLIGKILMGDQWRVAWTPSLIFKDLGDGLIRFNPDVPSRGRILDAKGRPLAQQGLVSQVGVVPGQIKDEPALLAGLSKALGIPPDKIKAKYADR